MLPGSHTHGVAKPSKANRTNIFSRYGYHTNPRDGPPHEALSCLSWAAEGIELLYFSSLFSLRQVRTSFCDSGRCLWFPVAALQDLLAFVGVTQAAPVPGEGKLSSQDLKCSRFSSYHSKESGKKMVTHFPHQLPYIKPELSA